jgi:hypothetical protein
MKTLEQIKTKKVITITNGCGGKKGTKCGVEVYIMPYMLIEENPLNKKN